MNHGIEIWLNKLNTVEIAKNGKVATIGGGTLSKGVTDTLWKAGKQTGMFPFALKAHPCSYLLTPPQSLAAVNAPASSAPASAAVTAFCRVVTVSSLTSSSP